MPQSNIKSPRGCLFVRLSVCLWTLFASELNNQLIKRIKLFDFLWFFDFLLIFDLFSPVITRNRIRTIYIHKVAFRSVVRLFSCSVVYNFYFDNQIIKKSKTLIVWIIEICSKAHYKKSQWEKSNQLIKRIRVFDFFLIFLTFGLIMSYFIEGQWKTDKDNRMSGHMTIIPFPVLY